MTPQADSLALSWDQFGEDCLKMRQSGSTPDVHLSFIDLGNVDLASPLPKNCNSRWKKLQHQGFC